MNNVYFTLDLSNSKDSYWHHARRVFSDQVGPFFRLKYSPLHW